MEWSMEMEPAPAWGPCEFQLPSWGMIEEPAAAGHPVEYASIDMFGACRLPAYEPQSCVGQQMVEYYYTSPSQPDNSVPVAEELEVIHGQNMQVTDEILRRLQVVDLHLQNEETYCSRKVKVPDDTCVRRVFEEVSQEFRDNMVEIMEEKMHRYPASLLGALHKSYTVPRAVAIGPYHHHRAHLKQAEKVKHMAAILCVEYSGKPLEEVYWAVVSAANEVRRQGLYDKDVMKGIGKHDFWHMMFFDACFMVQYMRQENGMKMDKSLLAFFEPNGREINHDVILLENQLPWKVVDAVLGLMQGEHEVSLEIFISGWRSYLQHHRKPPKEEDDSYLTTLVEGEGFKPHLLGLLRHYTVGKSRETGSGSSSASGDSGSGSDSSDSDSDDELNNRSISISAIELAEIGITLTPNKTMTLNDLGLNKEGKLLAELYLAPLALDRNRASFLLNMAALELCSVSVWQKPKDSAVCSYLELLALLVSRVEDVLELRSTGLLQGGGGLSNEEAFRFFTSFQGLPFGESYNIVMEDIKEYKKNRWMLTKPYAFFYNNWKIIAAVVSGIGVVGGIIGTLLSIKQSIA